MSVSRIGGGPGAGYEAILQKAASRRAESGGAGQAARTEGFERALQAKAPQGAAPAGGVGGALDGMLGKVSEYEQAADKMVIDLATGRDTNIHNTMVELEKADIALKYTVQLRNRALSAYEELMRIQV